MSWPLISLLRVVHTGVNASLQPSGIYSIELNTFFSLHACIIYSRSAGLRDNATKSLLESSFSFTYLPSNELN